MFRQIRKIINPCIAGFCHNRREILAIEGIMRRIRATLLVIGWLCHWAPAFAAPVEKPITPWVPPWAGLAWGADWPTLTRAKPDAQPLKPQITGPLVSVLQLPSGPVGDVDFSAIAQLDRVSETLRQVVLSHNDMIDPKHLDQLRQMLVFHFGQPVLVCRLQSPGVLIPSLDIIWQAGPTVVHLLLMGFSPLKFNGSDAIKDVPKWQAQLIAKNLNPTLAVIRAHAATDAELIGQPQCQPAQ